MPLEDTLLPEAREARKTAVNEFMDPEKNIEELRQIATFLDSEARKLQREGDQLNKITFYVGFISFGALLRSGATDLEACRGEVLAANYFLRILRYNQYADLDQLVNMYKYPDYFEAPMQDWKTTLSEDDAYDMMYVVIQDIRQRVKVGSSSEN